MANWRRSIACWLFFCECTQCIIRILYIYPYPDCADCCDGRAYIGDGKKYGRCQHMGKSVNQTATWHVYDCETRNTRDKKKKNVYLSSIGVKKARTPNTHTKKEIVSQRIQAKNHSIELNWKWFRFAKHLIYFHRFRLSHLQSSASKHSNSM